MPITYDRKSIYDAVRAPVFDGHLYQGQIDGIDAILTEWERLQPDGDPRFVAYMLATAAWETAHTMRPIEEYGHGRGRAYGHPTGPWHEIYDGRGDVQLTWEANYCKATQRLRAKGVIGDDVDLEKTPALAMRPDIAAAIMFYGMLEGWFTSKKLADYFNGIRTDWPGGRHIINGVDHAAEVGAYGEHFYAGLKVGMRSGAAAAVAAEPAPVAAKAAVVPPAAAAPVAAPPAPVPASANPRPAPAPQPTSLIGRIAHLFGR